MGQGLWKGGDLALIDGADVNGSARAVGGLARRVRLLQTGYLYWYALVMMLGVFGLLTWQLVALPGGPDRPLTPDSGARRTTNMGLLSLAIWLPIICRAPCCWRWAATSNAGVVRWIGADRRRSRPSWSRCR